MRSRPAERGPSFPVEECRADGAGTLAALAPFPDDPLQIRSAVVTFSVVRCRTGTVTNGRQYRLDRCVRRIEVPRRLVVVHACNKVTDCRGNHSVEGLVACRGAQGVTLVASTLRYRAP